MAKATVLNPLDVRLGEEPGCHQLAGGLAWLCLLGTALAWQRCLQNGSVHHGGPIIINRSELENLAPWPLLLMCLRKSRMSNHQSCRNQLKQKNEWKDCKSCHYCLWLRGLLLVPWTSWVNDSVSSLRVSHRLDSLECFCFLVKNKMVLTYNLPMHL